MNSYTLSNNSLLYEGKSEIVLPTLKSESVDLTVTSPPYDSLREYDGYSSFDFEVIAKELYRVTKTGGIVVWVVGDETKNGSESLTSCKQKIFFREQCGFNIHDTMIYQKSNFSNPEKVRYHQIFEYMFVLSKGKPKTFNPLFDRPNVTANTQRREKYSVRNKNGCIEDRILKERIVKDFGMRHNAWEYATGFNGDKLTYSHPAVFPEKLATDHILSWSNEGDTVLDCFAGSGTTLKAAKLLNRKSIGIEMSPKYCELIKNRLANVIPLFD